MTAALLLLLASLAHAGPRCDGAPSFRFSGAYFRKVESARAGWRGLEAGVALPSVTFDPARFFRPVAPDLAWQLGPLDRPSVYLGARDEESGGEIDAGLTWDRVYDASGRPVFTDRVLPGVPLGTDEGDPAHRFVSPALAPFGWRDGRGRALTDKEKELLIGRLVPDFAFRVFWRAPGVAWGNPAKDSPSNVYLYPGRAATMRLIEAGAGRFRLEVSGDGGSFAGEFSAGGFAPGRARFKRVDSIDQFYLSETRERRGNERRDALPTAAAAPGARWSSATLLPDGVALAGKDCVDVFPEDLKARWSEIFTTRELAGGGERVDIRP